MLVFLGSREPGQVPPLFNHNPRAQCRDAAVKKLWIPPMGRSLVSKPDLKLLRRAACAQNPLRSAESRGHPQPARPSRYGESRLNSPCRQRLVPEDPAPVSEIGAGNYMSLGCPPLDRSRFPSSGRRLPAWRPIHAARSSNPFSPRVPTLQNADILCYLQWSGSLTAALSRLQASGPAAAGSRPRDICPAAEARGRTRRLAGLAKSPMTSQQPISPLGELAPRPSPRVTDLALLNLSDSAWPSEACWPPHRRHSVDETPVPLPQRCLSMK